MFKVTARDQGHYKGPSGAFVTYCNISCFWGFFALLFRNRHLTDCSETPIPVKLLREISNRPKQSGNSACACCTNKDTGQSVQAVHKQWSAIYKKNC